jgi:two-component system NtrC family sensor kinase
MTEKKGKQKTKASVKSGRKSAQDFSALSHEILDYANRGIPRIDFLRQISRELIEFSGCDALELWFRESNKYVRCEIKGLEDDSFQYEIIPSIEDEDRGLIPLLGSDSTINRLRIDIISRRFDSSLPFFTSNGSLRLDDAEGSLARISKPEEKEHRQSYGIDNRYSSLTLIPLLVGDECTGLLQLMSIHRDYFSKNEIEDYEGIARTLGIALVNQRAQAALQERVKELACLYSIAQIRRGDLSLNGILQAIAELLPPAWQYPEITAGRIVLNGNTFATSGFQPYGQKQTSDIIVKDERRGVIEVVYLEQKPELDEGPFLREERKLINAIARQVGLIVERMEAEEDRSILQEQLRHADRLATLGQLAAGVAHELNEPLGNILGFAQLIKKAPELAEQARKDVAKIEDASLHAREVVKKLMLFGRQMPPRKTRISLNNMIEEGIYFLKSRCEKTGTEIVLSLDPELPEITADQSQLYQVFVNLAVNAVQAMPDGGKLTIKTLWHEKHVSLIVEDTGVGMSEEVRKKVFLPFFTTKQISEGTGIGLSVVHGIVTSHGGSIEVDSQLGRGSRFEIRLPIEGANNEKVMG